MKAKLAIISLLLLVALSATIVAQGGTAAQSVGVPFEIVGFEWKYQGYVSAETVRSETGTLSSKSKRGILYLFRYTAKASFKNLSAKPVKAVEWNYVFVDPENGKELKRYKIQSKQMILPNEAQTLVKDIYLEAKDDTRHLKEGKQKILPTRIEYADGSSWKP